MIKLILTQLGRGAQAELFIEVDFDVDKHSPHDLQIPNLCLI